MNFLYLSLLFILAGTASASAFGHGSISKTQVLGEVCAESISLCTYLTDLNIADQGAAIRTRTGERLMPYRFTFSDATEMLFVEIDRNAFGNLAIAVQEK